MKKPYHFMILSGLLLSACQTLESVKAELHLYRLQFQGIQTQALDPLPGPIEMLPVNTQSIDYETIETIKTHDQWGYHRLQIYVQAKSTSTSSRDIFAKVVKENKPFYQIIWIYQVKKENQDNFLNPNIWMAQGEWISQHVLPAHKKTTTRQNELYQGISIAYHP